MSKEEEKAYYRINEAEIKDDFEDDEEEAAVGEKKSKKNFYIVLACVLFVVIAVVILLLVLLLVGKSRRLPSGYNGFVQKEAANLRHSYFANIRREKNVDVPVHFDEEKNPEFTNVDFHLCMISQRAYRVSYRPNKEHLDGQERWTVPDYLIQENE